jgi:hypothetical protein
MIVVSRIESLLARRLWLPYALMVGLYALLRLPDVLAVANYSALVFPLESFYLTRLLFDGLAVKADIATTLVSPSNAALIYPPGLYGFNALVGKVSGLYWTLFVFQLAVGPLLYRLAAMVLPRTGALLLALLATYYFTRGNWWAPDFLIQPLMLLGVLLLLSRGLRRGAISSLLLLGQIVGLVIAFKHNVGVFFAILCGTWLFFNAFKPARDSGSRHGMFAALVLLTGFFAFIPVFGGRLIHNDEWLFYLLAYAFFWAVFICFLKKEPLIFDLPGFLRSSAIFSVSALALPGLIFLAFGSVVGYGRYWHSLFGMGLKFLPIWDHGIINKIVQHFSGSGVANIYHSLAVGAMFLLPLAVNLVAVWSVGTATISGHGSVRDRLAQFRTASLGIMGVFMFFPLEGYHILSSKLFLFIFVGAYFLRRVRPQAMVPIGYVLALMLLPVLALGLYRGISAMHMETASGSPVMQRVIGLPLQKDIAKELARQLELIHRNVRGEPYYVIDSSGGTLIGLATLEDNKLPQYYVEMREGILDDEVVAAIKTDLATRPFVIVNAGDYTRRDQVGFDPHLRGILAYIDTQYVQVDAYAGPQPRPAPIAQMSDFIVMRKR